MKPGQKCKMCQKGHMVRIQAWSNEKSTWDWFEIPGYDFGTLIIHHQPYCYEDYQSCYKYFCISHKKTGMAVRSHIPSMKAAKALLADLLPLNWRVTKDHRPFKTTREKAFAIIASHGYLVR